MARPALDYELLQLRMKSIQYESTLMKDVLQLQRMRIAQLEQQLSGERAFRRARLGLSAYGACRHCGLPARKGQVFCSRTCLRESGRSG